MVRANVWCVCGHSCSKHEENRQNKRYPSRKSNLYPLNTEYRRGNRVRNSAPDTRINRHGAICFVTYDSVHGTAKLTPHYLNSTRFKFLFIWSDFNQVNRKLHLSHWRSRSRGLIVLMLREVLGSNIGPVSYIIRQAYFSHPHNSLRHHAILKLFDNVW
jgi:hypothetical protein